jgi:hypothetical protein
VTKERLYSEDRKRGRALGIAKEVAGHQENREKQATKKSNRQFKTHLQLPMRGSGS